MSTKKTIYYWAPFLVPIATPKAVVNSAISMQKYSSFFNCFIINFFGEFDTFKKDLEKENVSLCHSPFRWLYKYLPSQGKIQSRFSYLVIFIFSFLSLKNLIKNAKPDFVIIHLITSLPLILNLIFKLNSKFILRISGLPRLGFFRKILWKIALKKVCIVTCPTQTTLDSLKKLNIVDDNKLRLLYDPVINIKKIKTTKNLNKEKIDLNFEYFFSAGRLTKQKNFLFLCKAFKEILKKYPKTKLLIAGEGEEKKKILDYIKKENLNNNIYLVGHVENIFMYMKKSKGFILSSLWEDPGFVILEAAFSRCLILSSNCKPGPVEIIKDNENGYLFESNNISSFLDNFDKIIDTKNKKKIIFNNLIISKKFTLYRHHKNFQKILNVLKDGALAH